MRAGCRARRELDEMYCRACGLRWDISDEDRPPCNPKRGRSEVQDYLDELREAEYDA